MENGGADDMIEWFEQVSSNAGQVQTEILSNILKSNYGVEYLKRWFRDDIDVEKMESCELESIFTSLVPLASHPDLEPFIQRIADGDVSTTPLLTMYPIKTLSLRSPLKLYVFLLCSFSHLFTKLLPFTLSSAPARLRAGRNLFLSQTIAH